jgi:hypothetical protein
MEMPLKLRERRDGALVAALPLAYRIASIVVLVVLILALTLDDTPPGLVSWVVLCAVALAAFYEERWIIESAAGKIVHRNGLLFLARRTVIDIAQVGRIRVVPFVKGTAPGTIEEAEENAATLEGSALHDIGRRRSFSKKRYLCILIETVDGIRYFVDAAPPRDGEAIRKRASRIAAACGAPLVEG